MRTATCRSQMDMWWRRRHTWPRQNPRTRRFGSSACAVRESTTLPLQSKDDAVFRRDAEECRPRVCWTNPVHRVFLTPEAIERAQKNIASQRSIALEIRRVVKESVAKVCGLSVV